MTKPLFSQRSELAHKAVIIHCLNKDGEPIEGAYASGFILREQDGLFLYTCWHVVTGIKDMHDLQGTGYKFERMTLRVSLQKAEEHQTGSKLRAYVIDGLAKIEIPLYEKNQDDSYNPLWCQEPSSKRLVYLETEEPKDIEINVPDKRDAVKLRLPDTFQTSDLHVIEQEDLWKSLVFPGERVYIVGYPYKFSSRGDDQPLAIVLTRFIAGTSIEGRLGEILLDGTGAPGMSGSPVFVEKDNNIYLLGLYAGIIYTSSKDNKDNNVGALGACVDMSICWTHDIAALCAIRS